jgi:hypothetical protein
MLHPRIPATAGVSLARLERGQCRYPIGELQPRWLLYCGKPALPGKSWCSEHLQICVNPERRFLPRNSSGPANF